MIITLKKSYIFILLASMVFGQEEHSVYTFDLNVQKTIRLDVWKYHFGDDPNWIESEYNDSAWIEINPNIHNKNSTGIHCYRISMHLSGAMHEFDLLAIRLHGLNSAFEVYWDGILISINGNVGNNREEEIPGNTEGT